MSVILRGLWQGYGYLVENAADPLSKNWFLVSSPLVLVVILAFYNYFCTTIGPSLMENRKPLVFKNVLKAYNLFHIILSAYIFYEATVVMFFTDFNFFCQSVHSSSDLNALRIVSGVWWYYMAKLTELFDTVFFVLRKSYRQISFLHLYHHTVMAFASWLAVKFYPGGQALFVGWLNCFVHIVMYTYYFISGLGPKYKKYLWWKRYLTIMQIVQFALISLQNIISLFFDCGYPIVIKMLLIAGTSAFTSTHRPQADASGTAPTADQLAAELSQPPLKDCSSFVAQPYSGVRNVIWEAFARQSLDNDTTDTMIQLLSNYTMRQYNTNYGFRFSIKLAWGWDYKWVCEPIDYSENHKAIKIAYLVYAYYLLKIVDLADTIFFVLRKKVNQVSFLHVYHHTGMVILTWGGATYFPGGHGTSVGVINSFVHVVMYSYYLLTVAFPSIKKSLWWKKYITELQILQLVLNTIHMSTIVFKPDCEYPRWTAAIFLPQNIFMLMLFFDFYVNAYVRKPKPVVRSHVVDETCGVNETVRENNVQYKKKIQ
ncbi:unnamed protein product [Parnassius apollo]|uniref:Elongation of very long chain fatty acids protein n=1 Tax=Parnassius apollo TaxID=110799 RepID=A0A8S3WWS4_PARAO|nr:unnamed protein product [Parnassius apollo]